MTKSEHDRERRAFWDERYTEANFPTAEQCAKWCDEALEARDKRFPAPEEHNTERRESWRPIETAPRDGTAILLMRNIWPGIPGGFARKCDFTNTCVAGWWQSEGRGAWVCYMSLPNDPACPFEPTHWMPLPAAPKESEKP